MTILDQPQALSQPLVYATFGERMVARIIDVFIVIIPSLFIPILIPWLYFAIMEGSTNGATVGKRAMGIRVISTEGRPIGFGTATGRFFANFLNIFIFFIGYLLMLFNARSQCLHDMITSTLVVKADSVKAPAYQHGPTSPTQKRSWTQKVSETETHFVEIYPLGGRHWHRTATGETVQDFTLWQLTDGIVDLSPEFGSEVYQDMKQYAEQILRNKV